MGFTPSDPSAVGVATAALESPDDRVGLVAANVLIAFVIVVLSLLLLRFTIKDLSTLKSRVYEIVSFARLGKPSVDDIKGALRSSSSTPPFSDLTLSFILFMLRHEGKITTSVLRVTCGVTVTNITTYKLCPRRAKITTRNNMHLS